METSASGSSWREDPVLIPSNLIPTTDENITDTYRQHWSQIRTRFSRRNRLQDWYNFRLSSISSASLREQLNRIFADQPTVFKVNFSFGFILRNTETGGPPVASSIRQQQPGARTAVPDFKSRRFRAPISADSGDRFPGVGAATKTKLKMGGGSGH